MRNLILASILALSLAACSQSSGIGKFTYDDAVAADNLAKAAGDTVASTCYEQIEKDIPATAAPKNPGLLYLNQEARQTKQSLGPLITACNGVLPLKVVPVPTLPNL